MKNKDVYDSLDTLTKEVAEAVADHLRYRGHTETKSYVIFLIDHPSKEVSCMSNLPYNKMLTAITGWLEHFKKSGH